MPEEVRPKNWWSFIKQIAILNIVFIRRSLIVFLFDLNACGDSSVPISNDHIENLRRAYWTCLEQLTENIRKRTYQEPVVNNSRDRRTQSDNRSDTADTVPADD